MRVLHVLASQERRGAEVFASALIESLAGGAVDQRVTVLHPNLGERVSFSVPTAVLSATSVSVPGIRLNVTGVRNLGRVLASFRPDVVQAHGGEPLKYALAATRGDGRRIVYRRIGDSEQFGGDVLRRRVYARLIRRSARVIAVAQALRAELIEEFGVDPERAITIPNAVDARSLEPSDSRENVRGSLGIRPDAKVVLSLGALTWEKDPLAHLDIVTRAVQARTGTVHVFAGDGPLRLDLEREIERRGVGPRTLLLGSRSDVSDLLAASDVLLMASRTEGMPACVIEAGMMGLPVVGYALAGVAEVVAEGETGCLVRPLDVEGAAKQLALLLGNASLRRRMGEAARERCRAHFDIRSVAPGYLGVYEQVYREAREVA